MLYAHVVGGSNPRLGDILVIAGSTLYAISNVSEVRWLHFLLFFYLFGKTFSINNMAHYIWIIIAEETTTFSQCNFLAFMPFQMETVSGFSSSVTTLEYFNSYISVVCLLFYFHFISSTILCLLCCCISCFGPSRSLVYNLFLLPILSVSQCECKLWELLHFSLLVFLILFENFPTLNLACVCLYYISA